MIPQYLDLTKKGGALARLSILRNASAYTRAPDVDMPPSLRLADWRECRKWTLLDWHAAHGELSQGFSTENPGTQREKRTPVWVTHGGPEFRDERFADEVDGGPNHRGWFSDADCSRTIRGLVARLSHGRFLAGYYSKDNNERLYFGHVFDTEGNAARFADGEAESAAEVEKEYDERWHAARELADDCETLENDIKELIPMRHHARARRELKEAIGDLRDKRETLAEDYADIEI